MTWSSSATTDTNPWYQLSAYTLSDVDGNIDFQLVVDEQFPTYIYEDARAPAITESGYST